MLAGESEPRVIYEWSAGSKGGGFVAGDDGVEGSAKFT